MRKQTWKAVVSAAAICVAVALPSYADSSAAKLPYASTKYFMGASGYDTSAVLGETSKLAFPGATLDEIKTLLDRGYIFGGRMFGSQGNLTDRPHQASQVLVHTDQTTGAAGLIVASFMHAYNKTMAVSVELTNGVNGVYARIGRSQAKSGADASFVCATLDADGNVTYTCDSSSPNGATAVAVAILSISSPDESTTYADIARSLAADYYNIYVVDLETDKFVEYSSLVGGQDMEVERHGEDFFESSKRDAYRIYEEDREIFYAAFSKEQIVKALDEQGVFTVTYRLVDTGVPVYVNMKVTRMQPGSSKIILGISIIDAQMKQKEHNEKLQNERAMLVRVMALSDGYLSLFTVDPETGHFLEYTRSYATLGTPKDGDDFFGQSIENAPKVLHPDDQSEFLQRFSKENIMRDIRNQGHFTIQYRIMIDGVPKPVELKIAPFKEGKELRLFAAVKAK
jgi:hypothetical protein